MTLLARTCSHRSLSDMKKWKAIRESVLAIGMVCCSFIAGWFAYGHDFANSRRIQFDFSQPYVVPTGHEPISTAQNPETASFLVGDRIDILVQIDDSFEPLILDAVVTDQTKTRFGMLLPHGGRELLGFARVNKLSLKFRISSAPIAPITIKPHRPE